MFELFILAIMFKNFGLKNIILKKRNKWYGFHLWISRTKMEIILKNVTWFLEMLLKVSDIMESGDMFAAKET